MCCKRFVKHSPHRLTTPSVPLLGNNPMEHALYNRNSRFRKNVASSYNMLRFLRRVLTGVRGPLVHAMSNVFCPESCLKAHEEYAARYLESFQGDERAKRAKGGTEGFCMFCTFAVRDIWKIQSSFPLPSSSTGCRCSLSLGRPPSLPSRRAASRGLRGRPRRR